MQTYEQAIQFQNPALPPICRESDLEPKDVERAEVEEEDAERWDGMS